VLIDIARITELSGIAIDGDEIVIGATTRHADLVSSEILGAQAPILSYAAAQVGDPQIRHRGTIGGSVAHADPWTRGPVDHPPPGRRPRPWGPMGSTGG
jgi:aerobic carbon-monoxide dehydrogenase medium subunit